MTDGNNEQQPEASEEQQGPRIEIELTREGISVKGNHVLKNMVLAFGMLEAAKHTIAQQFAKMNESPIARVPFLPPGLNLRQ